MKKIREENKKKIMEMIEKAGSEEYETEWDEKGLPVSKKKSEVKRGKKSRAAGTRFELKVRNELEAEGWVIDKWTNNVDLEEEKLVKAKRKFNPYKKVLGIGTGFPDFIGMKLKNKEGYEVIGIEVKANGWLDREEKAKCKWLLDNKIFSRILIARRGKKKGKIDYEDFEVKYGKKYNKT